MDPLTSLAIASSVISFVDFGSKIIFRTVEIYKSPDNVTKRNADIDQMVHRLSSWAKELSNAQFSTQLEPHEQALHDHAKECVKISDDLLSALGTMKAKSGPLKSLRSGFKAVCGEEKVTRLKQRLEAVRSDMIGM